MTTESGPGPKVNIDVGAKATLDIKAEVPTESAGRFVDALTDLIRPWSEGRGLKGDLIRLQREEVAFEIAQRAAKRLALENVSTLHPIPLKIIIPLLENGSHERPGDDFMISLWANLLASAALEGAVSPRYIGILSELNGRQANLLLNMFVELEGRAATPFNRSRIAEYLSNAPSSVSEKTTGELHKYGFHKINISGYFLNAFDGPDLDYSRSIQGNDLQILSSLGLIELLSHERKIGSELVIHEYCGLTPLGADLIASVQTHPKK